MTRGKLITSAELIRRGRQRELQGDSAVYDPRMHKADRSLKARAKLDLLTEALVDDIMQLTDDELIQEAIEAGEDPDEIAQHVRGILERAISRLDSNGASGAGECG